jgi:hypothetical protein
VAGGTWKSISATLDPEDEQRQMASHVRRGTAAGERWTWIALRRDQRRCS